MGLLVTADMVRVAPRQGVRIVWTRVQETKQQGTGNGSRQQGVTMCQGPREVEGQGKVQIKEADSRGVAGRQ